MTGQGLLSIVLLLTFIVDTTLSYNQLPECSGQLTRVNTASITMATTTAMTCQCAVTLHGSRNVSYAFKADVLPSGTVSSICVSRVSAHYLVAPLRKDECVNRITHWTRNPVFCGWYTCINVYFNIDGSSVMRLKSNNGRPFNIQCAVVDNQSTPGASKTSKTAPKKPSTTTTPKPEAPSTTTSATTTTTTKTEPTPQPETPSTIAPTTT